MRGLTTILLRFGSLPPFGVASSRRSTMDAAFDTSLTLMICKLSHCVRACSVEDIELDDNVKADEVLVKMLAAPITPADLTQVRYTVSVAGA